MFPPALPGWREAHGSGVALPNSECTGSRGQKFGECAPVLGEQREAYDSGAARVAGAGAQPHRRVAAARVQQPRRHDGAHPARGKSARQMSSSFASRAGRACGIPQPEGNGFASLHRHFVIFALGVTRYARCRSLQQHPAPVAPSRDCRQTEGSRAPVVQAGAHRDMTSSCLLADTLASVSRKPAVRAVGCCTSTIAIASSAPCGTTGVCYDILCFAQCGASWAALCFRQGTRQASCVRFRACRAPSAHLDMLR